MPVEETAGTAEGAPVAAPPDALKAPDPPAAPGAPVPQPVLAAPDLPDDDPGINASVTGSIPKRTLADDSPGERPEGTGHPDDPWRDPGFKGINAHITS